MNTEDGSSSGKFRWLANFLARKTDSTINHQSYSNHTGWEITPLAATSHASKRTQGFQLKLSVVLRVCFPKNSVSVRSIPDGPHVHHIDWNPKNNDSENLIDVPVEIHEAIHRCDRDSLNSREKIVQLIKMFDEREGMEDAPREQKIRWVEKNMKITEALGFVIPEKHNPADQLDWHTHFKKYK